MVSLAAAVGGTSLYIPTCTSPTPACLR